MSNATLSPLLVSVRDAAEMLAISERTIHELTKSGQFKPVKIGSRGVRYSVRQLEQFIADQLATVETADGGNQDLEKLLGGGA